MRLLLDECAGGRYLRDLLIAAGHDVLRTVDVLGGGADDPAVFAFACQNDRPAHATNNGLLALALLAILYVALAVVQWRRVEA